MLLDFIAVKFGIHFEIALEQLLQYCKEIAYMLCMLCLVIVVPSLKRHL